MKTYSTAQVLRTVGIGRTTLLEWLRSKKIAEPRRIENAGINARLWTDRDVEKIKRYKQENYRKGRGRKPKPKR